MKVTKKALGIMGVTKKKRLLFFFLALIITIAVLTLTSSRPEDFLSVTSAMDFYSPSFGVCKQNPYARSLEQSLDAGVDLASAWLSNLDAFVLRGNNTPSLLQHTHARFFPFDAMLKCKQTSCIGGPCRADESKIMCGLEELKEEAACVVYSIGGNNQWGFEKDLLQKTECEIHTFDCTGSTQRFKKPGHSRLHFHHVCLGTKHEDAPDKCLGLQKCGETWTLLEMQQRLNHSRIDLFKMDIEGFEWPIFESWPELSQRESENVLLPMQVMVELHYWTQFSELMLRPGKKEFKFPLDLVYFQAHLLRMGYIVVSRDDNKYCKHCTELTLIRAQCPSGRDQGAEDNKRLSMV